MASDRTDDEKRLARNKRARESRARRKAKEQAKLEKALAKEKALAEKREEQDALAAARRKTTAKRNAAQRKTRTANAKAKTSDHAKRMAWRKKKPTRLATRIKTKLGELQLAGDDILYAEACSLIDDGKLAYVPAKVRKASGRQGKWEPDKDMPLWLAYLVANGRMCGARHRRSLLADGRVLYTRIHELQSDPKLAHLADGAIQLHCRHRPPELLLATNPIGCRPIRCYAHAGQFTLAATEERIMEQGSFYAACFDPEEAEMLLSMIEDPVDSLNAEISMMKIRLRRKVKKEARQAFYLTRKNRDEVLELKSLQTVDGYGPEGNYGSVTATKEVRDYSKEVASIVAQLCRLIATRHEINGNKTLDEAGVAARIRGFVNKAWDAQIEAKNELA